MGGYTVKMKLEKTKKLFETTKNLGSQAAMIAVEKGVFKKVLNVKYSLIELQKDDFIIW